MKLIKKNNILLKIKFFKLGGLVLKFEIGGKYLPSEMEKFAKDMHNAMYKALINDGVEEKRAKVMAAWITGQKALESQYGLHIPKSYNYGGVGKTYGFNEFNSLDHYAELFVKLLRDKYSGTFKAKTYREYNDSLFTDEYGYNPYNKNRLLTSDPKDYDPVVSREIYWNGINDDGKGIVGTRWRVGKYINMTDDWDFIEKQAPKIDLSSLRLLNPYGIAPQDNTINITPSMIKAELELIGQNELDN